MRIKTLLLLLLLLSLTIPSHLTAAPCPDTNTSPCLVDDRFSIEVTWTSHSETGAGFVSKNEEGLPMKGRSSINLSFFNEENWELLVKVIDGCALNGQYWVFYSATTDVVFRLRVKDHLTDAENTYVNPGGGTAMPALDTQAFSCSGPHFQMETSSATQVEGKLPSVLMDFTGMGNGIFSWLPEGRVSFTPNARFSGITNGWFHRRRWVGKSPNQVEVQEHRRLSIVVLP